MSTPEPPFPRLPSQRLKTRELAGAAACGLALDPSRGPVLTREPESALRPVTAQAPPGPDAGARRGS